MEKTLEQSERDRDLIIKKTECVIRDFHERKPLHRVMHRLDKAHYERRADDYYKLKDRFDRLDPVKDYSERNSITLKLIAIREDFNNLENYYKN